MKVPFFNYSKVFAQDEREYTARFRAVLARGAFILQAELKEFEAKFAAYLGVKHAIGVANCTDGLHLLFRAAGLRPGDEVIFPSHTMVASPSAVIFAGGVPVPVDCGPDHLIDPASVRKAVTNRTRFLMPVHLNGRAAAMGDLLACAEEHRLTIIEDAAQALGAKWLGRFAGTFGAGAAYSFYPAKTLGCLGDGGAVVTDDDGMAERMRLLRDHGRNEAGDVVLWGLNSRLDNLQASFLLVQLDRYEKSVRRRREIAVGYQSMLADLAEVTLPPSPDDGGDHFDVFQNYEIEADRRDDLKAYLFERGVGTLVQWGGKAVHQHAALGFRVSLPATELMFTRCLMLPLNTSLTDAEVAYVAGSVRAFYGR